MIRGSRGRVMAIASIVIVSTVIISLITALATGAISLPSSSSSSTSSASTTSDAKQTTTTSASMPKSAASSASKWMDSTLAAFDSTLTDGMFDSSSTKGTKILEALSSGDWSSVPTSVQGSIYWESDAFTGTDHYNETNMRASAYSALMTAWQLKTTAKKNKVRTSVNSGLVYVDRTRGTVTIPAEAICGIPADLQITLVWTGKTWAVDGVATAVPIISKLRVNEMSSSSSSSSSSD